MSTETTSFVTNTAKPVLALTMGGGNVAYPQNPMFTPFGAAPNPMMNTAYNQMQQPPRQQAQCNYFIFSLYLHCLASTIYSAPQEVTRPAAYSMSANTQTPYFINPMMMNYIPQNMQGNNQGLSKNNFCVLVLIRLSYNAG